MEDHDRIIRLAEQLLALAHSVDVRFAADKEARLLAYDELQRRLDVLNHAHEEARRVQGTYISRETYELSLKEVRERAEILAASVPDYLRRDVFDNFVREQTIRDSRMTEAITALISGGGGDRAGSQRVTAFVFALVGLFVSILVAIVVILR